MSTDDLDTRIRALVASAAADAPPAPALPATVTPLAPRRSPRPWAWAAAAVATAAAVIAAVVVLSDDDDPARITAASSTTSVAVEPTTWPADVTVVVASDRGIERVAAEDGVAVVQQLTEPFEAAIAFELSDGSLVYQYANGEIELRDMSGVRIAIAGVGARLEDARVVDGVVQVAFSRTDQAADGRRTLSIWTDGAISEVTELPGGRAVSYGRFQFDGDLVLGAWSDDTGQRGVTAVSLDGTVEDAGLDGVLDIAATDGRVLALIEDGTLVNPRDGEVMTLTASDVVAMDLAADQLVTTRTDGTSALMNLTTYATYPLPVASGVATVSLADDGTNSSGESWPSDVTGVIASDRGVELAVSAGGAGMAVQNVQSDPLRSVDVAFQVADGSLVVGPIMDVALIDERLDATTTDDGRRWVSLATVDGADTRLVQADFDGQIARLTHGLDIFVGQSLERDGGWRPLLITQDGSLDEQYWEDLGVAGPHDPAGDPPRLFSVSPTGRTIGWVHSGEFVLGDGRRYTVPDGATVMEVDLTDAAVALSRAEGPATLIDLRSGRAFEAPGDGRMTISLSDGDEAPVPTTIAAAPVEVAGGIVTAGPDGVWESRADGDVQWTAEWMGFAVKAPDGSMIMQRGLQYELATSPADTLPLIQRVPGGPIEDLFSVLMPAADPVAGWYRFHDAATVDGHDLLLLERQTVGIDGIDTEQGVLMTLDLSTGELRTISDRFGGWEQGSSRLHLSATGLVVGEYYDEVVRRFFFLSLLGDSDITAAQLGLEETYSDCVECPRLYTVDEAGTRIAWLDGTELVLWDIATRVESQRIEVGDAALAATDLDLGDGFAVLDRRNSGNGPLLVTFAGATTELPGDRAAIA